VPLARWVWPPLREFGPIKPGELGRAPASLG